MENFWKVKPIKINPIRVHFNLDIDGDKVKDKDDCDPFNRKRQHISKTMEERLKKLPIYVSPKSIFEMQREKGEDLEKMEAEGKSIPLIEGFVPNIPARPLPHIMSKEAKEQAPKARQMFLSSIKKYPGVVGQMEKIQPKKVIIASEVAPPEYQWYQSGWVSPSEEVFIGPPSKRPESSEYHAQVAYHELQHAEQRKHTNLKDIQEQYSGDIKYTEVPMEAEAIQVSKEKMKEYRKGKEPSGKSISKILGLE